MKKNNTTSARGRHIDMGALAKKHENERAVSNVPMNARGDIIDSRGQVKVPREKIKQEYYKNTVVGDVVEANIKGEESVATGGNVPDTRTTQKPVEEMTQSEALDELAKQSQEVNRVKRTRSDGSEYYEVEYEDGSMEEIDL